MVKTTVSFAPIFLLSHSSSPQVELVWPGACRDVVKRKFSWRAIQFGGGGLYVRLISMYSQCWLVMQAELGFPQSFGASEGNNLNTA